MVEYIEKDKAIEAVENIVCSMSVCMNIDEYKAKKQMKEMAVAKLKRMPTAQPEIIRCKDCAWYELPSHRIFENCVRWMESNGILLPIKPDDFCSRAERKTDGQTD